MDETNLRYAVTLAEELHFGRSARLHFISEVQFGRRIRQLEAELGVRLFERTSRRVRVTPEGARALTRIRRVLGEIDGLRPRPRPHREPGVVHVGVLGFGVGDRWGLLREHVARSFPELRLVHHSLDLDDQYLALQCDEVDVALVHHLGDVDALELQFVMETPRVAVVSADSPFARARSLDVDDVPAEQWLRLATADPRFADWIGPASSSSGGAPPVTTLDAMTTAVATTGLVGVHGAAAARFYARPDVCFVPLDGAPVATAVATRRGDERPEIDAFREAARAVAQRPTG